MASAIGFIAASSSAPQAASTGARLSDGVGHGLHCGWSAPDAVPTFARLSDGVGIGFIAA